MARMKKPENETTDQATVRHMLETIANHATRSEKTAWNRKRKNMESLVRQLAPLENKILELRGKMQPIYDEITESRKDMIDECIHPFDLLIHKEDHIECKFCFHKLVIKDKDGPE